MSVGVFVGVSVGVLVGESVGVLVDVAVGVFVGVLVGVGDGVLVGEFVGVGVPILSRVIFLPLLLEYETTPKVPFNIATELNVLLPKEVLLLIIV